MTGDNREIIGHLMQLTAGQARIESKVDNLGEKHDRLEGIVTGAGGLSPRVGKIEEKHQQARGFMAAVVMISTGVAAVVSFLISGVKAIASGIGVPH